MKIEVKLMDLEDRAIRYVENNPIEIYVDYRDELSKDQVDKILEGEAWEVRDQIEMDYDYYDTSDMVYYKENMADELDVELEEIENWFDSPDSIYPSYQLSDSSWRQLLRNTSAYIVGIVWEAEWNFYDWAYGQPVYYRDVKEALRILDVNPKEFYDKVRGGSMTSGQGKLKGWFPDLPQRKAKVDVDELYDNMCALYNGVLHFCFGDLENIAEVLADDSKYLTIEKGTNIVMYNRMDGAGITEVELIDDVVIKRKDIEFRNDTSSTYGVQSCYGFVSSYWTAGSILSGKKREARNEK